MENKAIKRILTAITVVIMVIGIIISAISIYHGDEPGPKEALQLGIIKYNSIADPDGDGEANVVPEFTVEQYTKQEKDRVDLNIANAAGTSVGWGGILTFVTVFVMIVFVIIGIVKNPKGLVKMAVTFGGFALLLIIVYFATASDSVPTLLAEGLEKTGVDHDVNGYNMASWGIATSIILIALAILAWIGGGIYGIVKK
jgi:hypothetical protein